MTLSSAPSSNVPDSASPAAQRRDPAGRSTHHGVTRGRAAAGLAVSLVVMALGNVATIVLGPLVLGVVQYPVSESILNQLLGLELVTLGVVVPWSILAAARTFRGDPLGPVLAIGPSAYTAYMLAQYVVGPEYDTYRVVALAHVALFGVAAGAALWSFTLGCRSALPPLDAGAGRRWGVALAALAMVVALRYAHAVVASFTQESIPTEFADAKAFYWSIVLLDLGVVVPATLVGAAAVWRGWAHARVVVAAVLGWFALVPPSVAAMATVMVLRDDVHASSGQTTLLWVIAVVAVGIAARGLRVVVRGPHGSSS